MFAFWLVTDAHIQQQSITDYRPPIARHNRIGIIDDPDLGGSGDGVRSGPGSLGREPAPILLWSRYQRHRDYWFS